MWPVERLVSVINPKCLCSSSKLTKHDKFGGGWWGLELVRLFQNQTDVETEKRFVRTARFIWKKDWMLSLTKHQYDLLSKSSFIPATRSGRWAGRGGSSLLARHTACSRFLVARPFNHATQSEANGIPGTQAVALSFAGSDSSTLLPFPLKTMQRRLHLITLAAR